MTTSEPVASVIIAAYNVDEYLQQAIDSVLNQSLSDFELIIVDDGSTDGTWGIIESMAADSRVRAISHGTNRGAPTARNSGLDSAKGTYVAFLDGDDVLHPDMLLHMVTAAQHHDVEIVTCGYSTFRGDAEPDPAPFRYPLERRLSGAALGTVLERAHRDKLYWFNTTFIYRRDLISRANLRFATDVVMVDTLFSAQALRAAHSIYAVPEHLYVVRQRAGSTTRHGNPDWNANIGGQYRALRSFYDSNSLWSSVATDYYGYVLQFSLPQAIANSCVLATDRRHLAALLRELREHEWVINALQHLEAWRGLTMKRRLVATLIKHRLFRLSALLYARQITGG